MVKIGKLEEVYKRYRKQIDSIVFWTGKNFKKAAEIVSWLYGVGTTESWRKFLSKQAAKPTESTAMQEFIESLAKKKVTK